jgi:starch-binding outer membrane protein, SusD/RagB family
MKATLKIYTLLMSVVLMLTTGCNKILEENPRAFLTEEYFATAEGLQGGVTAAYATYRSTYGGEQFRSMTVFGTDEYTQGRDGGAKSLNLYDAGLNAGNGTLSVVWNDLYNLINTCNGVIELGPNADIVEATKKRLIAEARYLRANAYFLLVQTFGDVPLNLEFNQEPNTIDYRDPVADVYNAIIDDLNIAVTDLTDTRPEAGRVFKATALHLLAKVYLTRGSTSAAQASDYTTAYTTAKTLIDNQVTHGVSLLPDFGSVHAQGNENNSEVLWAVQWNNDIQYNNTGTGARENWINYFYRPSYDGQPGMKRDVANGRPWQRFRPLKRYMFDVAFADKGNDSRYNKTFQTVWYCNNTVTLPNGRVIGDTCVYMPNTPLSVAEILAYKARGIRVLNPADYQDEPTDESAVGNIYTWKPYLFPSMSKYDDANRLDANARSVRPALVYKFSEAYLIMAEAAVMGGGSLTDAATYLNVLRRRAAYRPKNTPEQNAAAALAMEITAGDLTIDFILDERTRELFGEGMRWFDLKRTGKLVERVQLYNLEGKNNVKPYHVLRPIPQSQIDLVGNPQDWVQNPGYDGN